MLLNMQGLSSVKLNPNNQIKIQQILNTLTVGKILEAQVIKAPSQDRVLLNINNQHLEAQTSHRFQIGEKLTVRVASHEQIPVLEVIKQKTLASAIENALRQVLPKQVPAKSLLNTLNTLLQKEGLSAKLDGVTVDSLPKNIQHGIKQLLNQIGSSQQMTNAQSLKHHMQTSGHSLENRLQQTSLNDKSPKLQADFKGNLFQLLKVINEALGTLPTHKSPSKQQPVQTMPSPHIEKKDITFKQSLNYESTQSSFKHASIPVKGALPQPLKLPPLQTMMWESSNELLSQLKEQVQQVIARVQANQMHSLSTDTSNTFLIDLPVKHEKQVDVLPLLIEKDTTGQGEAKGQDSWSVMLAIDLDTLGPMQVKVSLVAEEVRVSFWSENARSLEELKNNRTWLEQEMTNLGLQLEGFNTSLGLKENELEKTRAQLLDIKI